MPVVANSDEASQETNHLNAERFVAYPLDHVEEICAA